MDKGRLIAVQPVEAHWVRRREEARGKGKELIEEGLRRRRGVFIYASPMVMEEGAKEKVESILMSLLEILFEGEEEGERSNLF